MPWTRLERPSLTTDPVAGYACLYGGYDYEDRAAPGQEPWSRLRGFGPAFFIKFLYSSKPGALILDNWLAAAVHRLSQLPYLVTRDGRSVTWTPYRYSVYLHWMAQTGHRRYRIANHLVPAPDLTLRKRVCLPAVRISRLVAGVYVSSRIQALR